MSETPKKQCRLSKRETAGFFLQVFDDDFFAFCWRAWWQTRRTTNARKSAFFWRRGGVRDLPSADEYVSALNAKGIVLYSCVRIFESRVSNKKSFLFVKNAIIFATFLPHYYINSLVGRLAPFTFSRTEETYPTTPERSKTRTKGFESVLPFFFGGA